MRALAQRAYGAVESGLWAGLVAFVIYFAAFVAPNIPSNNAAWEANRLLERAADCDHYCERLGKRAGTRDRAQCVLELQEFRAKIEREMAELSSF